MPHLLPHKRGKYLRAFAPTALVPEEGPNVSESGDGLTGIEALAFAVRGPFLFRFELHRLPLETERNCFDRLIA
jgi:hypothetical protein